MAEPDDKPETCPPREALRRFLEDRAAPTESQIIAAHLETCLDCQTRCEQLTQAEHAPSRGDVVRRSHPSLARLMRKLLDSKPVPAARTSGSQGTAQAGLEIRFPEPPDEGAPLGRLDQYAILAAVSEGNQGILFRALDESLNRVVAIKVVHHRQMQSLQALERFRREARLIAAVQSEFVVRVFQAGQHPGFPPFLVMEFIEGESLRQRMDRGALDFREAAIVVRDTSRGLEAAHSAGLVHRDVKPSNILLDQRSGHARLTDFGLAIEEGDSVRMTQDGVILGTPAYMSPEQVIRVQESDARSDVYSLGVVLYELLTGEVPFRGTVRTTLAQLVHEDPRPPGHYNDSIPRDLETICLKAMRREPAGRFQSAAEFTAELNRWLEGQPIISRPSTRPERFLRWCRRNPGVSALSAAVCVLLISLSIVTTLSAFRMDEARQLAEAQAAAAERQSEASLKTLSRLIYELQKQFDQDFIDLSDLQQQTLRIAIDGLREVGTIPGTNLESDLATAEALRRLGETLVSMKQETEAISCATQAVSILRRRFESGTETARVLKSLTESLWLQDDATHTAAAALTSGRSSNSAANLLDSEAPRLLNEAVSVARRLYEKEASDDSAMLLGKSLLKLGGRTEESDPLAAAERLEESMRLFEPLQMQSGEPGEEARSAWLEAADLRFSALMSSGDRSSSDSAGALLDSTIHRCNSLIQDFPEDILLRVLRLELQDRLIRRHQLPTSAPGISTNEQPDESTELIKAFESQVSELADRVSPDLRLFLDVGDSLTEVLRHRLEDEDFRSAGRFANALLKICESRLTVASDDPDAQIYSALCWTRLAETEQRVGASPEVVRHCFAKALENHRALLPTAYVGDLERFEYFETLVAATEFDRHEKQKSDPQLRSEILQVRDQLQHLKLNISPERLDQLVRRIAVVLRE